jgi:N-acyl-D-amino-acid deacylase
MSAFSTLRLLAAGGALLLSALALPAQTSPSKSDSTIDSDKKAPLPMTGKSDAKFAKLDQLMTEMLTRFRIPGGVLAVAKDGKLVYSRGFGYAEVEKKEEMKQDALFRISSMSKPFTAVAVMQLVEQGKLKLDDPIMDVLALKPPPGKFDERWKKITIRHLLEHRGGWDSHRSRDPMFFSPLIVRTMGARRHPATPALTIAYMLRQPLDFEPGEKFVYSNFGYCLLGRVIERLTKQKYETHVKEKVLKPLGITRMRQGRSLYNQRAPGEVRYYCNTKGVAVLGPQLGRQVPFPYGGFSLETMDSEGGWLASAEDLVRYMLAFTEAKKCKVLKPKTVEGLFERPLSEEKPVYYAKGWLVQEREGKKNFWHDGSIFGVSGLMVHRADGITFAVLFNTEKAGDNDPAAVIELPLNVNLNLSFGIK